MAETERLRGALEAMVWQFAYYVPGGKLTTGGLSALEEAFDALGWDDPHDALSRKCDEPDCPEEAIGGFPVPSGRYRRTCFKHYAPLAPWAAPHSGGDEG